MPRISIELPADIIAELDATADELFSSRSAALRLHWKRYRQMISDSTSNMSDGVGLDTGVHGSARERTGAHTPDPGPPPAEHPDPDQKKKDQDQKEQDRKGDARGKPDLNGITYRVIARINEIRPAKRGFEAKTYRPDVGRLLKRGHKESELIEVVEWRAEECRRTGDWLWFKPGTLFRVTEFAKRLDESRAGVEHGKAGSRRGQRDLYETPDATDAIWMKGVDNA